MPGFGFLKQNFTTIMKDIQPIKQLTKKNLREVDKLEITIYNPNSKFNKTIFRTHKYECRIFYTNYNYKIIEENTCKLLIKKILSSIEKDEFK